MVRMGASAPPHHGPIREAEVQLHPAPPPERAKRIHDPAQLFGHG